jgi:transketolase
MFGGLGEAVARVLSLNYPAPQEFIAVNDTFGESGTPTELLTKYGLDTPQMVAAAETAVRRKTTK